MEWQDGQYREYLTEFSQEASEFPLLMSPNTFLEYVFQFPSDCRIVLNESQTLLLPEHQSIRNTITTTVFLEVPN